MKIIAGTDEPGSLWLISKFDGSPQQEFSGVLQYPIEHKASTLPFAVEQKRSQPGCVSLNNLKNPPTFDGGCVCVCALASLDTIQ